MLKVYGYSEETLAQTSGDDPISACSVHISYISCRTTAHLNLEHK